MKISPRALLVVSTAAFGAFATLAIAFAATSGPGGSGPTETPLWAQALGAAAGPVLLPLATLGLCAGLVLAGRLAASRFLLLAVAGAGALTYALKALLQALGADDDGGTISDFPSGHAAAVSALAGALLMLALPIARGRGARLLLAGGVVGVPAAVGWSRVASGAHTWLDIAGGATLAVGWVAVCLLLWGPQRAGSCGAARSALGVAFAACAGLVALLAAAYDAVAIEDARALERIDARTGDAAQGAARVLEALGGRVVLPLVLVASLAILLLRFRRGEALFVAVVAVGADLLVHALRLLDEPARTASGIPDSSRFPSGHATTAVAVYGVLALAVAGELRDRRAQALAVAGGLALGCAIGTSQLVLGTKAPSDVLAGCLLAGAWLSACVLVRERAWAR